MPIRSPVSMRRLCALGCLLVLWSVLGPGVSRGEEVRVTPNTQVRSIRFEGANTLSQRTLTSVLSTRGRGSFYGLRSALGKLPLIGPPPTHPFSPRTLQEDVVRLRNRYFASGFRGTEVRYRVEHDESKDLLDITFVIEEGVPLRISDVRIVSADGSRSLPVPPEADEAWKKMERRAASLTGNRPEVEELLQIRNRVQAWWRNRGFPEARVTTGADQDSLNSRVEIRFLVDAGPRKRFGSISVEGNRNISDHTLLRELPFESGDYYSQRKLDDGRRDLQVLQIVRAVRIETSSSGADTTRPAAGPSGEGAGISPPVPAADSLVAVRVKMTEAKPRVIGGQLGYGLDIGVFTEADWSHRNFTGGARVLTLSGFGQTGQLALVDNPDIRYRGSVSLLQPHFLRPRINAVVSPFIEYREDTQDRSLQIGSNFTLVYEFAKQLSLSLDYQIATRRVYEYRFGELGSGGVDLLTLLTQISEGQLDSLGTRLGTSLFTLSGLAGTLNDISNPRKGVLVRPTVQVTAPTAWSEVAYWKADGSIYGFVPVSRRTVLAARLSAGQLFPFGKSIPRTEDDILGEVLQLRDANFTAGGSNDVRGWANRRLGPKFPDVAFRQQGDSLVVVADGYVPLGGFKRVSFSVELRLPMPLLGPRFGSHLFLDGGRVWSRDARFGDLSDPLDQDRFFYAAGAGLDILTPVGAIKFSLGYKLNPSVTDLVDAQDLVGALIEDSDPGRLEKHNLRRFQLNLVLGTTY